VQPAGPFYAEALPMKVLCPYTKINPLTAEALDLYAPDAERVELQGAGYVANNTQDFQYGNLLLSWWRRGEPFVLVEHDIVLHDRVIPEFEECDHDWCTFSYSTARRGTLYQSLGCVRFSARLLAATQADAGYLRICPWWANDQAIAKICGRAGFAAHTHWPMVEHRHNQFTGDDSDGREEDQKRRGVDLVHAEIKRTKDPVAATQTDLPGMRLMGFSGAAPIRPPFNAFVSSCPDCGGLTDHQADCVRVGHTNQYQDADGVWPESCQCSTSQLWPTDCVAT
jgi:hypothetical protein